MAEIPWGLVKGIGTIAVVLFFALLGKLLLTKTATASASATAATAAATAAAATAETAAGTTTTTTTPSSRTGFEDGPNSPSYQRPDPVSVTTPESCISDHPGTYFQNGQCVGCRRVANMHESIDSSSLSCSGPRGSTILATPITLDNSDYGGFPISGGPETIDLFCKLSNYYNTKEDGTGECLPFEGGPCNDEYCAENGVNGGSLGGITSREDCVSPNVWVGEYHQNRGVDSAGSCNICDLTENTIDYEGRSRNSFFNSLECNACEPGASRQYVNDDGECVICPEDHIYSPGPPATCAECSGGRKYINATTSTCDDCPANKYYNATNRTCVNKIGGGLNHPCGTGSPQNVCNTGFECNEQYVPSESVCKISLYNAGGGICDVNADCIGRNPGWGTGPGLNRDCSSATMMSGDRCVD